MRAGWTRGAGGGPTVAADWLRPTDDWDLARAAAKLPPPPSLQVLLLFRCAFLLVSPRPMRARTSLVVVALAAMAASAAGTRREPLIVALPDGSGMVEGLDLRDGPTGSFEVNAFLGIPFAQPPTKTRRWTSPKKNLPWKGVRPAKQFAPNCMQLDPPAWGTMKKNVSEDCLYLNVWTPAQEEGEQKELTYPVMVFIHGGGYVSAAVTASVGTDSC